MYKRSRISALVLELPPSAASTQYKVASESALQLTGLGPVRTEPKAIGTSSARGSSATLCFG